MLDRITEQPFCQTRVSGSTFVNADCFDVFPFIEDKSIDAIICDLPYGTTKNKWDSTVPLDKLWAEYERIISYNGAIVLFAQTPFDKVLGASKIDLLKYEYVWNKKRPTGHLNSKFAPMKQHENILVFSKASASFVKDKSKAMCFNPQFTTGKPYTIFRKDNSSSCYDLKHQKKNIETVNDGYRYPTSILEFAPETGLHPTQKPLELMEYLVKTYTNEGDTVLDNTMGSGTTILATIKNNRIGIGIEKEKQYYDVAVRRASEYCH